MKVCVVCGGEFNRARWAVCSDLCLAERQRKYQRDYQRRRYWRDPEKQREIEALWREKNREKLREYNRERKRKRTADQLERQREYQRKIYAAARAVMQMGLIQPEDFDVNA